MKLVDNARYLSLLRDTVEASLVPELQSDAAKASAGLVLDVIGELLRRELRADAMLDELNAQAAALAARMCDLLVRAGAPALVASPSTVAPDDRLGRHAEHAADLTRLCAALAALRDHAVPDDVGAEAIWLLRAAAEWDLRAYLRQGDAVPATSGRTGEKDGRIRREQLEAFVRRRHPDGDAVTIKDFEAIPGGFGKQTSRFTLVDGAGHAQALIVRKNDAQPMIERGTFRIDHEFDLVCAVSATGYPAPKPLWLGVNEPGVDAAFYVMERLPGRVPGTFLGGAEGGSLPEALLLDLARRLAQLHAIPLETFGDVIRRHDDPMLLAPGADGSITACYRRSIEAWRRYVVEGEHLPSPYFLYLIDWLMRSLPEDDRRPVLVHGDFNIHNLLAENGRVTGVLDWECACFGAPEQDLAYIQPHLVRYIDWDRFMAAYREAGGPAVDPSRYGFYMAYSMMRLHVGMCRGLLNLQTGANSDVRYAAIELGFISRMMEMGLASTR